MDTVAEIKSKLNIIDLIGTYVQLKRSGKNYKGLCPFHSEKTPSFMVSEEIQQYRCFGCGKSGDMFSFIMDYEGLDFSESLKMLADKAGVEVKYDEAASKKKGENQKIIEINSLAVKFYSHLLQKHDFGREAREYLKNRGIKAKTIEEFQLGYAPKSWDSLAKFIQKDRPSITPEDIQRAGLGKIRDRDKGVYDMFRGRLVFPFVDPLDRPLGFSARALNDDMPKYINSPETPIFHKERFLFGLNRSKQFVRKEGYGIIVEGMMDMISLYQSGYKNVASTNGTALTPGQINMLKRYTDSAVLVFDNDDAGVEAAVRGVSVIQNSGLNIKVALLPDDVKDPDDLMQKDPKRFKKILSDSLPLWDFYFSYAVNKYNMDDVFGKKNASEFLLGLIKDIDDEVVKSEYVKKFAVLFDMDETSVLMQMDKVKASSAVVNSSRKTVSVVEEQVKDEYPPLEVYTLVLLVNLNASDMLMYFGLIDDEYFSNEDVLDLYRVIKKDVEAKESFDIKAFYDKLLSDQPNVHNLFEKIYLIGLEEQLDNSEVLYSELTLAINRLKKGFLVRKLKALAEAIKKAEAASDSKLAEKLQQQVIEYSQELNKLSA